MDIEGEEIIAMLRRAELIGAWKALNWIGREWTNGMTLEDLTKCLQHGSIRLEEELAEDFKREYCISVSVSSIMERRLSEKVITK